MTRRTAWLCDFDGTIGPDVGAAMVHAFSPGRDDERRVLLARWMEGGMGHRELTIAECALMRVTEAEAEAFALGHAIDPGFAGFVREARARGDVVMVVSEGFDFYVRRLLGRAGLDDLEVRANRAVFEGDAVLAEFPHPDGTCTAACGNCKAQHVRAHGEAGFRTVMVGDGLSDRCGARAADRVVARGSLLAWCATHGVPAEPFHDFSELAARARADAA